MTATLDSINVMTAGVLKKKDGATIQFEPLLQSSADSELLPVARLAFLPDSQSLLEGFKPSGERYVVAARVHGKLKSAYPNGAPAEGAEHKARAQDRVGRRRGPGRRRGHRHARRPAVGAHAERVRPALRHGLGEQRRLPRQRGRQPRRQRRPDQHPRPAELLPAVHQGRRAAPSRRRAAARQGEGARHRAEGHREEAVGRWKRAAAAAQARSCSRRSRKRS